MCEQHGAAGADAPGTFAEGQADPGHHHDDARQGRFGDGQAQAPRALEPGRFSEEIVAFAAGGYMIDVDRKLDERREQQLRRDRLHRREIADG